MRSTRLVLAALAFSATSLEAQSTIQFMTSRPNPAVSAFGYFVGPFSGTITSDPGRPTLDLYCVDILNSISFGQSFTANFSGLTGDLSQTRGGNGSLSRYQKAAFLASQYRAPGVTTAYWGGIQAAVWELLNPGAPYGGWDVSNPNSEAYWMAMANNWYNSAARGSFDFSRWTVVTDVRAAGLKRGGVQEFLTSTDVGPEEILTESGVAPEPETWALMGTGLLLIIGFALKRGQLA